MHRPPRTLIRRLLGTGLAATLGVALIGGLAPAAHATAVTFSITAAPTTATVPTGTTHTITFTVTKTDGSTTSPAAAAHVIVFLSGANYAGGTVGGEGDTGPDGMVALPLAGHVAGTDSVLACVDLDRDGNCAPTEPQITATVTWTLNQAPTADDQLVITAQRRPTLITLTGTDPDGTPISFTPVTAPLHGTLTDSPAGLVYTPAPGYTGPDSFDFVSDDGTLQSDPATVSIIVQHDATLTVRQEHRPRTTVNALLKTLVPAGSSARPRKIVVLSDDGQELIALTLNRSESDDRRNNRNQRYVGTLTFNRRGKVVKLPVKASWNGTTRTVTGEWERGHDEGKFTLVIDPAPMASGALKAS